MTPTSSTSNNNIDNANKEYNPCAGKSCDAYGKYQLKILYINKTGWFCDSCAQTLKKLKLVEVAT